jgi:hypothetical protein
VNNWYTSKLFWGSLVTLIASLLGAFGIAITPEMQDQIVNYLVPAATGIGGLVTMAEHVKANKKDPQEPPKS